MAKILHQFSTPGFSSTLDQQGMLKRFNRPCFVFFIFGIVKALSVSISTTLSSPLDIANRCRLLDTLELFLSPLSDDAMLSIAFHQSQSSKSIYVNKP